MAKHWRENIIVLGPIPENMEIYKYWSTTVKFHDIRGMPTEMTIRTPVIREKKK